MMGSNGSRLGSLLVRLKVSFVLGMGMKIESLHQMFMILVRLSSLLMLRLKSKLSIQNG